MKTKNHFLILFLLSLFLAFGTGCAVIRPNHHPSKTTIVHKTTPGHMKKMTGTKSAKSYALGQVKKYNKK
jgi:hypothetical protein